ncbi:MAG: arginine--tRNA ligase [Candidatus Moeniiplasma glomeromycotorum]|nr:arginine--tRNA ligase [Candidatus Moeniiplasma glomeromycotorum]MCE8162535.1 arginine--tRNA ligase [Candidatus Moeniiplasma glomeromycotorum]MCE8166539.1 arginine--tRNA ligase [Candidatus Moeniiplasma glomeromycotorum]MCE8166990.1 arginine--tRNA ligase [Candidatus Moeniiplasma glomeromycotorum]
MRESLNFKNFLATYQKIAGSAGIQWRSSFLRWDLPNEATADFTLTLPLPLAYKTKKKPRQVAQELIDLTGYATWQPTITPQGYLNFHLPLTYYQQFLTETYQQAGQNLRGQKKTIRVNLEYVSTNPTGYLHLAHFRHAMVGNTLANIYQFSGYSVTREFYLNDRGGQITSLVNSIYYFYHQLQEVNLPETTKIEYSGSASQAVAQKLIEKWGTRYINKKLGEGEFKIWKKEILDLILAKIRQDLAHCGIYFDIWFSETSLYEKNKHLELLEHLKEKKLIYHQEGAVFFRSSLGGDDKDWVIIKQDGDYTYFFSDILYLQDKLSRAEQAIYILGADHHSSVARLKAACQLLGYSPQRIQIILVQMVNLLAPTGQLEKFSKRAGNTIELTETLQYLGLDQLKFFLGEKEVNQPLLINPQLLKENQEKTRLYYIQYAHARCHQIFQKAEQMGINQILNQIDLLGENERKIFNWLIRFPLVLEKIIEENKPHHLVHYLHDLAQTWQSYYQKKTTPILDQNNSNLTSQKLLLVKNIQIILQLGLNLMGIETPKKM